MTKKKDKRNITRRKGYKKISLMLESGMTKKEVYLDLKAKFKDKTFIGKILASFPSQTLMKKFQRVNSVLFILILVTAVIKVIKIYPYLKERPIIGLLILFLTPIINIYLAAEVIKFRGYIYRIISTLSVIALLQIISDIVTFSMYNYVEIALLLVIAIIAWYLGKNIFPHYTLMGPKRDESGNIIFE